MNSDSPHLEAVTECEKAAGRKFKKHLKNYQGMCSEHKGAVRVHRQRDAKEDCSLGEAVFVPDSDVHHILDSPVMLAISHAIEDLALEHGGGELISTFQDFKNFAPQKERYLELAEKLDSVRVWGSGEPPEGCRDIDFVYVDDPKVRKYWLVLYDNPECHAMLLCRQVNRALKYENKKFVGFYSFNPYLVQSIRWRFNLLSSGLAKVLTHWEQSFQFPSVTSQHLQDVA
ncbi:MAG: DICT sensory domain-containing protein [Verrucomicrobiota bacterium]